MKVISQYDSIGETNNLNCFTCELDKQTFLKIGILDKNKCEIKMENKITGLTEVSSEISQDDLVSLIRVFRNIQLEMQKLRDKENSNNNNSQNGGCNIEIITADLCK